MDKSNVSRNASCRFGCHSWGIYPESLEAIPTFAEAGARWVRLTRPVQIDICAKGPGKGFDFATRGEDAVDRIVGNGMSIMGLLDLRNWPEGIDCDVNPIPWGTPIWEHWDFWEDFVAQAVAYYRDRIRYWEVINEPPFFWWYPTSGDRNAPAIEKKQLRRAPVARYAELLHRTAACIRAADPQARIVSGAGFPDGRFLDALYRHGCKDDFDIAGVHYLSNNHPESFEAGIQNLRRVMAKYGDGAKPVWDTENGPGGAVIGFGIATAADYEACAHYYRHCLMSRGNIERYFWFNPTDAGADAPVQNRPRLDDGSLGPSYQALKAMTSRLGDAPLRDSRTFGREGHAFVFDAANGPVTVAWGTAPCRLRLPRRYEGARHDGMPLALDDGDTLDARPVMIEGDLLADGAEIQVAGRRNTTVACHKQPKADTPTRSSPRLPDGIALRDVDWAAIPVAATREAMPLVEPAPHFCTVATSVVGDLQFAHDGDALFLRFLADDPLRNITHPTGAIQFTLRDSDPGVLEWPYFFNGYALFTLWASTTGGRLLRNDSMRIGQYPGGIVPNAEVRVKPVTGGIEYTARIPWSEIGPCRPGKHNPFFFMLNANRADNMLDVPVEEHPEDWSHNWADCFIVKDPAWMSWIVFE